MSENNTSIRADLQAAGRGKEITGHELMDIARFCEDTSIQTPQKDRTAKIPAP